jgi:hypothetical protein
MIFVFFWYQLLTFLVLFFVLHYVLYIKLNSCFFYSYKNLDIALNCGNMLRECIKYPTLAK